MRLDDLAKATELSQELTSQKAQLEYLTRPGKPAVDRVHCLRYEEKIAQAAIGACVPLMEEHIEQTKAALRALGVDPT